MTKEYRTNFGIVYQHAAKDRLEVVKGELEDLMVRYNSRRVRTYELSWLMDLMCLARKMGLGQLSSWDGLRQSSYIYGQNLAFFDDSMKFAICGERDMAIPTWIPLLDWSEDKKPERIFESRHKRLAAFAPPESDRFCDLVESWCRQKDGPADMLCTLYALFCGNPLKV